MSVFKVGDEVVCIKDGCSSNINGRVLTRGKIYIVEQNNYNGTIFLKDTCGIWSVSHFVSALEYNKESIKPVVKDSNPKDAVGIRKVPMSVLPANVLMEAALGMMEGARKYRRHNYRVVGVRSSVYYDATMRHLMDYWEGEDIDTASGVHHLSKAISSLIVWRDALINDCCTDDRPPKVKDRGWLSKLNSKASDIVDKFPNSEPAYTELDRK